MGIPNNSHKLTPGPPVGMLEPYVGQISAEVARSFVGVGCWARLYLDGDAPPAGESVPPEMTGGVDGDVELITVESRGGDGEPQRSHWLLVRNVAITCECSVQRKSC